MPLPRAVDEARADGAAAEDGTTVAEQRIRVRKDKLLCKLRQRVVFFKKNIFFFLVVRGLVVRLYIAFSYLFCP